MLTFGSLHISLLNNNTQEHSMNLTNATYYLIVNAHKGYPNGGSNRTGADGTLIHEASDSGVVAGIVIAAVTAVAVVVALCAFLVYRHYLHRNVTSMNFDNPVYRKTTEDQFSLEKNGYAAPRLYPSTVCEEAQEPLTTTGTNEYV